MLFDIAPMKEGIMKDNVLKKTFTLDEVFPDIFDENSKLVLLNLGRHMGLEANDLAFMIGTHPSQIYKNSFKDEKEIGQKLKKLLATLTRAALERADTKDYEGARMKIMRWFKEHNPDFGMQTPSDLLRAGKIRKLQSYADSIFEANVP